MRKLYFYRMLALILLGFKFSASLAANFLVLSDPHLDKLSKHQMNFTPSSNSALNDLDEKTFRELLATTSHAIQQGEIPKPKFILFLGDIVGHLRMHEKDVERSETTFFKLLQQSFPHIPILYAFGNNDSLSANYGPFTSEEYRGLLKSPFDVASKNADWHNGFLSTGRRCSTDHDAFPCLIEEDTVDGYYSVYIESKLRLIILNSVLFSANQFNTSQQAAKQQFNWLKSQLNTAQTNHEQVLIAMHIPPGRNVYDHRMFWHADDNQLFLNLIEAYHQNIMGILAAHTHQEEIKIIQNTAKQPLTGVYLTAALSTSHGNSPSIKLYEYAKQQDAWQLINYSVFYFLKNHHTTITLKKLYDYNDHYCHDRKSNLFDCLKNITAEKMATYFRAGNTKNSPNIASPDDIFMRVSH